MPISVVYDTTCINPAGKCCLWEVPAGVQSATFEIWGGGGGGGSGVTMCDCCARTQSGGGGGYAIKEILVTAGAKYTVCAGNGGFSPNCTDYGAEIGYCCNGITGGTSFVTGTNLSNFCATGGTGGSNTFTISCYGHCGCNGAEGGRGYGGTINAQGAPGVKGMAGSNACDSYTIGGVAGGPGGGVGGWNNGIWPSGNACSNPKMHGRVPGGGGAGSGCGNACACCNQGSGRGAPGFVKITW